MQRASQSATLSKTEQVHQEIQNYSNEEILIGLDQLLDEQFEKINLSKIPDDNFGREQTYCDNYDELTKYFRNFVINWLSKTSFAKITHTTAQDCFGTHEVKGYKILHKHMEIYSLSFIHLNERLIDAYRNFVKNKMWK